MHTLSPDKISKNSRFVKDEQLPPIAAAPILQAALSGLDVILEEELERYRHWQANGQTFSYLKPFRSSTQVLGRAEIIRDRVVARHTKTASPQLPPTQMAAVAHGDRPSFEYGSSDVDASTSTHASIPIHADAVYADLPDDIQGSNPKSSGKTTGRYVDVDLPQVTTTPQTSDRAQQHTANFAGNGSSTTQADGFLHDDELFRHIADSYGEDEETPELEQPTEDPNLFSSLLTPVGIAAMLLLLAISAGIGYLVVDPSGFSRLMQPKQTEKNKTSSYLPDAANNIDIKTSENPIDPSTLLVDPQNSKAIPFVSLPGNNSLPGQSLDSFTAKTPLILPNSPNPLGSTTDSPVTRVVPDASSHLAPTALPPVSYEAPAAVESYSPPRSSYSPSDSRLNLDSYQPPSAPRPRAVQRSAPPRFESPVVVKRRPAALPSYTPPKPSSNTVAASSLPRALPVSSQVQPRAIAPLPITNPVINRPANLDAPAVRYAEPISAAPRPAPAPVKPIYVPPASTSQGYKVVVENSYVNQVQQVEKDAYVRPSDGKLQLGAYQDAGAAQQRAAELRQQGIPARVD